MKSFFEEFSEVEPNAGGFIVYRKDGSMEYKEQLNEDLIIFDSDMLEDLLYKYCKDKIAQFSDTPGNKDVYAFVLYLGSHYGDVTLYFNTHEALNKELSLSEGSENDKIWTKYYGIGDFEYMIDEELPEPLNQFMRLYLRINDGQGKPCFDYDLAVTNDIFGMNLIHIGERVVNRLKPFTDLNTAADFIGYVADHEEEYFENTVDEDFYNKYVKLS